MMNSTKDNPGAPRRRESAYIQLLLRELTEAIRREETFVARTSMYFRGVPDEHWVESDEYLPSFYAGQPTRPSFFVRHHVVKFRFAGMMKRRWVTEEGLSVLNSATSPIPWIDLEEGGYLTEWTDEYPIPAIQVRPDPRMYPPEELPIYHECIFYPIYNGNILRNGEHFTVAGNKALEKDFDGES